MKQLLKTFSQHASVCNVESNDPVHDTIDANIPPIVANEHLNLVDDTSTSTANENTSIQLHLSTPTCIEDDSENVEDRRTLAQNNIQTQDKEKSYFNIFIEMITG